MTRSKLHFSDIKQALSAMPLNHLLPKLDLVNLSSAMKVDIDDIQNGLLESGSSSFYDQLKTEMHSKPEEYQEVINFIARDFREFNDGELENLKFKRNTGLEGTEKNIFEGGLQLSALENRLYEEMEDVEESCILGFDYTRRMLKDDALDEKNNNTCYNFQKKSTFNLDEKTNREDNEDRKRIAEGMNSSEQTKRKKYVEFSKKDNIASVCENLMRLTHTLESLDDQHNEYSSTNMSHNYRSVFKLANLNAILDSLIYVTGQLAIEMLDIDYWLTIERMCLRCIVIGFESDLDYLVKSIKEKRVYGSFNQDKKFSDTSNDVLSGLIASRIVLLIADSRRKEKEFLVTEYFNYIIDLVSSVFQGVIISIALMLFENENFNPFKNLYATIVSDVTTILELLSNNIRRYELDDYIVTKLEYLCTMIAFTDGNVKVRGSLLHQVNFEGLRLASVQIIVGIFKCFPDQRLFLLNEVLSNFVRVPEQKSVARQYRLARGNSIQVITAVLLLCLQSYEIYGPVHSIAGAKDLENVDDVADGKNTGVLQKAHLLQQECWKAANEIVNFMVNKLFSCSENNQRHTVDLLVEDLVNVLKFPEWPAAEIFLKAIFKKLISLILVGSSSSLIENYSLEWAGLIGCEIFEIKIHTPDVHQLNGNSTADDIYFFDKCFNDVLTYVQICKQKNTSYESAFGFLLIKCLCFISPLLEEDNNKESQLEALHSENDYLLQFRTTKEELNQIFVRLSSIVNEGNMETTRSVKADMHSSSITAYVQILLSEEWMQLLESFLGVLMYAMRSNKVKLKAKALRILSSLVNIDSKVLTPKIQESIAHRLVDLSPLVRDATIELISRFILSKPEIIEQFYRPLCDRLGDESIQVRKRIIKLSKSIYMGTEKRSIKSYIALRILRCLDDEDDIVQSMAKSLLEELLFTNLIKDTRSIDTLTIAAVTFKYAEVIMDVVSSDSKTISYFESFMLSNLVSEKNEVVTSAAKLVLDKSLDFVIDCLGTKFQADVEKALRLLSTFVLCDGKLMSQDQLVSLQPYLVDEENSGEAICYYSLRIMRCVLPEFTVIRPQFVEKVQASLLKRLTRFSVKELNEAMPCIWKLCCLSNDTVKVANASISCIKLMRPFVESSKREGKTLSDNKLYRLLNLLGSVGKYCKLERHRELFLKSHLGLKENETVTSVITKYLLFFCGVKVDSQIRKTAIRNILGVCSTHPKLYVSDSVLKILDRELNSIDTDVRNTIIQGLIDFLKIDEINTQRKNEEQVGSSKEKQATDFIYGETQSVVTDGICVGLTQRYLEPILKMCLEADMELSYLPVIFLQQVVQLGFANPKVCIPYIIALEASSVPFIRHIAFQLHSGLFGKYESLTDSSYLEGLRLAVRSRKNCSSNIYSENFFMKTVYSIVSGHHSSRKKFIQSISRVFNVSLNHSKLEENTFQRDLIIYSALNLSVINFMSLEEVMILVHNLDKVISKEGLVLADFISREEQKGDVDQSNVVQKRNLCVNAQSLSSIIIFREYLVGTYSLNQSSLESFRPNTSDNDLRQTPKIVLEMPLKIDTGEINMVLKKTELFGSVYSKFLQLLYDFMQ